MHQNNCFQNIQLQTTTCIQNWTSEVVMFGFCFSLAHILVLQVTPFLFSKMANLPLSLKDSACVRNELLQLILASVRPRASAFSLQCLPVTYHLDIRKLVTLDEVLSAQGLVPGIPAHWDTISDDTEGGAAPHGVMGCLSRPSHSLVWSQREYSSAALRTVWCSAEEREIWQILRFVSDACGYLFWGSDASLVNLFLPLQRHNFTL